MKFSLTPQVVGSSVSRRMGDGYSFDNKASTSLAAVGI